MLAQFSAYSGLHYRRNLTLSAALDGPFVAGARTTGKIVGTKVDAEVAETQKQHARVSCEFWVEHVEPTRLFSFRWHPLAVEPGVDYSKEPTTLVEFELKEVSGGTMLTITESGFDRIPLERRAKAFASHEQGWTIQAQLIEKYLTVEA